MMPARSTEHRIEFAGEVTIWIVAHEQHASSWRVHRGPRTVAAIELELARERRAGRRANIEIEIIARGPVELSVPELVALGVLA
jgi:hypothetical protein